MLKRIIIAAIILPLVAIATIVFFWYNINNSPDFSNTLVVIDIKSGQGTDAIAKDLKKNGLISSELAFKFFLWKDHISDKIKAGQYEFHAGQTMKEITDILISGRIIKNTQNVTLIEGWNIKDMDAYLAESGAMAGKNFLKLATSKISEWKFSYPKPDFLNDAPKGSDLEGYLFPDTYEIYQDKSAEYLIEKMLDNFDRKLTAEDRQEIARQKKSIYEIVTMASIIQKEVKTKDMRRVSGIFWKRIANGQRLESCASLAYILGVNKKRYSYEDTLIESPYNTYRQDGLPPGPISNPGSDAIKAAVYPENSPFIFFLSRPDTGETVFSRTLEEHNANKDKYLK
jgi:UPF0755 protein